MKTIYKYPLEITDRQKIKVPCQHSVLKVGNQREKLCLWVQVYVGKGFDEQGEIELDIRIVGTGNPIKEKEDCELQYFDSVIIEPFVWHVYFNN